MSILVEMHAKRKHFFTPQKFIEIVCVIIIENNMSRNLSLEEVMAMLEGGESGDDDPMEVVTAGSDDDMDAEVLYDDQDYGCKKK